VTLDPRPAVSPIASSGRDRDASSRGYSRRAMTSAAAAGVDSCDERFSEACASNPPLPDSLRGWLRDRPASTPSTDRGFRRRPAPRAAPTVAGGDPATRARAPRRFDPSGSLRWQHIAVRRDCRCAAAGRMRVGTVTTLLRVSPAATTVRAHRDPRIESRVSAPRRWQSAPGCRGSDELRRARKSTRPSRRFLHRRRFARQ
jgi:hypothetical protein